MQSEGQQISMKNIEMMQTVHEVTIKASGSQKRVVPGG